MQVHQLRHQVYCVEHHYEKPRPDGLERDRYDKHAVHAALIERQFDTVVGCVRLVLPLGSLPISEVVDDRGWRVLSGYPRDTMAEVSRYAISNRLRRRAGEDEYPDVHYFDGDREERRRLLPHLTLGLMLGVAQLSVCYGITHLTAMMAPALIRLLGQFGMTFTNVGSKVDYHGVRQPCVAATADLLAGIQDRHPAYYAYINREFAFTAAA
jgi:N-acyl amino acid synthase of PEP-CTERM/exosortase system